MNKDKIILVGLPGSGKSTLGKKLASQLNFPFYDLDDLIVQQEKEPVADIFYKKGEGYFRRAETKMLEEQLNSGEPMILATGGGAPCFNDNMERINEKGISVFLDVPLPYIVKRMGTSEVALRPLFQGLNTGEITAKLLDLYTARIIYYDMAKIKLSGEDISTELIISELMTFFRS